LQSKRRIDTVLAIVHLNWEGTESEFGTMCGIVKEIINQTQGIDLVGLYVPSNDWNYAAVYKVKSFSNFLDYQRLVREKLKENNLSKIPKRQLELYVEPKTIGK
jgi:hypothetical protein